MAEWSYSSIYTAGDTVTHNNLLYIALVDNQHEDPETSIYWMMLWENDVEYEIGELVRYRLLVEDPYEEYELIKTAPIGTLPTNTEYWKTYDTVLIKGEEGKIYDLDEIVKNKDRMSDSSLVLPTTNTNLEEGSIMIESPSTKRKLPDPTIGWTDFKNRLKR